MTKKFTQEDYKNLKANVELLASGLVELKNANFIVCVVQRDEDWTEGISAIYTNLATTDKEGNIQPATIGLMTDLLIEAKLQIGEERVEKGFRNVPMSQHKN